MESLRCPSPFLWVFSSPKGYSPKWTTQCYTEVKRLNHKSGGEHLCHFCSYGRPHSSMERGLAVGELGQIEETAAWTWTWRWETYLEARIKWRKKWIAGVRTMNQVRGPECHSFSRGPRSNGNHISCFFNTAGRRDGGGGGAKTCISRCV